MPNSTQRRTAPDPWVAAKLSTNPDELSRLTRHTNYTVRVMAATNPHTPMADRAALLSDPDRRVHQAALTAQPPLPWHHIREHLHTLTSQPSIDALLFELVTQARQGDIPDHDLAPLIQPGGILAHSTWATRITRHSPIYIPDLGPETFAAAAMHPSIDVRVNIASHPHCPEEVLIVLADDPAYRVCSTLATQPTLPGDVILTLAHRRERPIRDDVAATHGRWLFTHADTTILGLYGRDTSDTTLLCTLALHTDPVVRREVALNPLTTTRRTLMRQYVTDTDTHVRATAARNYDFDLASSLVHDPEPIVRCALADNPDIDATHLSLLAQDTDPDVAQAAGQRLLVALAA